MHTVTEPGAFYSLFRSIVEHAHNVVIMAHRGPDDDAISSVLTVYSYLNNSFPDLPVSIFFAGAADTRWRYFEHFEKIQFVDESAYDLSRFDLFIGVDACEKHRFVNNTSLFDTFNGEFVFVDHHQISPEESALAIVRPDYPSCSYLLYDIFYKDRTFDSPRIAETILLGILGDTGNFRYIDSQQTGVFLAAERLVREGKVNIQDLMSRYSTYSEKVFLGIRELAHNVSFKEIDGWPKFMYSYLTQAFITDNLLSDNDISAANGIFIAQYGTALQESSWSMVFTPRSTGDVSVSMRSRPGSVNVRKIGQDSGWGGGHNYAAGAKFKSENGVAVGVEDAMQRMFGWLTEHTPTLS